MKLEIIKDNEVTIVKPLFDSLNAAVSTEFRGKFIDLINEDNILFILDLSEVNFIDSAGLGSIIALLKLVKGNEGLIVVCGVKPTVVNLFKLTRMDQFFTIRQDKTESLAFLTAQSKK